MIVDLTRIDPFHAIGIDVGVVGLIIGNTQTVGLLNSAVGVQVVSSVPGICDDAVGMGKAGTQQKEEHGPLWYRLL